MSNVPAPLDIPFLLSQVGGSSDVAKMVLEEFAQQTPIDITNIKNTLAADDVIAAGKVAHSLKGASGVLGANLLRGIAAELETVCIEKNLSAANAIFPRLSAEADRCVAFIPTVLSQL